MKYKQLANQYKQEIEQLKQEIERLKAMVTEPQSVDKKDLGGKKPNLSDTSLTLQEAGKRYHWPDESTDYSVTLWGGAHFEGERPCSNENCVNKDKMLPVGKMKFSEKDGVWSFYCSLDCLLASNNLPSAISPH